MKAVVVGIVMFALMASGVNAANYVSRNTGSTSRSFGSSSSGSSSQTSSGTRYSAQQEQRQSSNSSSDSSTFLQGHDVAPHDMIKEHNDIFQSNSFQNNSTDLR